MCCVTPNQSLPFLRPVLITHKVVETIALSYHLIEGPLRYYANVHTNQFFRDIHASSHKIEPLLHFMCFLGDVACLATDLSKALGFKPYLDCGSYIEYQKSGKVDALKTAGKVCHTCSHLLSSISTLTDDLKVVNLTGIRPLFKYQSILSVLGYGLWTASLVWKKARHEEDKNFKSNLGIYLGGFVAESLSLGSTWKVIHSNKNLKFVVGQIASIAGLIHCVSSVSSLMKSVDKQHRLDKQQHQRHERRL